MRAGTEIVSGVSLNSDEVVVDCDTMDDYFLIEKKLQNNVQT